MSDGCGTSTTSVFACFLPDGFLLRMSQDYFQPNLDGSLPEYSETFPKAGMMRNGKLYRQPRLICRTSGKECSLLPTANTEGWRSDGELAMLAKVTDEGTFRSLTERAAESKRRKALGLLPTPTKNANSDCPSERRRIPPAMESYMNQLLPTPTTQDASNNGGPSQSNRNSPPHSAVANGKLNPRFVEAMMGFPIGFTDLEDSGTP